MTPRLLSTTIEEHKKRWQAAKGGEHVHHTQRLPEDQETLTQDLEIGAGRRQEIQPETRAQEELPLSPLRLKGAVFARADASLSTPPND